MKRNKIIRVLSLLALGISLLSFGFVQAAELVQQDVQAEQVEQGDIQGYVPSLQRLALNYIGKKKLEGNEKLFGTFKELVEQKNMLFGACKKDITREVAKIAALEYAKLSYERVSPLNQYKKVNPALGFLIDQQRVEYSLSIQDLMNAGAIIAIQNQFGDQVLHLNDLSLTSLDGLQEVANLPSLQNLYLENNQLKELTLANLPSLRELYLSDNQLKELTPGILANLPSLRELYLSNNQLKELTPGTLANLPSLQWLYLSDNQLKELTPGALANLPSLQKLYLSNNQLKELTPGALANLPVLRWLYLENNQLKELAPGMLENLPALQLLNLENNQLTELAPGAIENLPSLQYLYLGNNQLTKEAQRVLRKSMRSRIRGLYFDNQRVPEIEEIVDAQDEVEKL